MQETEQNIQKLNSDVHGFEEVLAANQRNMAQMNNQMNAVKRDIDETATFFRTLTEQMAKISAATEEINQIASNTGLLAVNASIEAARAGAAGKGFSVVATNVRELAVNSTQCSNEVADLVANMQVQIGNTSRQLSESANAIAGSLQTLASFQDGFTELLQQFKSLYGNIEAQNQSVEQVSVIFEGLKDRVATMSANSDQNQTSVESIAQTMRVYRENIAAVIEDNRHIQELSENMLNISQGGARDDGIE
jgi:methyl-accepting chemotaxis protein